MWLMYSLKLTGTLWLLNLNNFKYIVFWTIYVNIILFEHSAPLKLPRHTKAAAAAAAAATAAAAAAETDLWLLAGTVCDRKNRHIPHCSLIFSKGTKI
jgi:hypothetical protein